MATSTSFSSTETFEIHTALLFSPISKTFLPNVSLIVAPSSGLIVRTITRDNPSIPSPLPPQDVDLTHLVVLPGLVDSHTHIFLHAFSETSGTHQMLHESRVERILRASNHGVAALKAGYTTYRDLGTEGMGESDIGLRDAINRGIIPGPRLFVATNPIASSAGYIIPHENSSTLRIPPLADVADGVEGVRAAVRRRIGAGADIVKFYADQEKRVMRFPQQEWPGALEIQFPPEGDEPNHYVLFSEAEMRAMVDEAHESKCPIAAHACSLEGVLRAAKAGVDTVEHGQDPSDEALAVMKQMGTIFVPTLTILEKLVPEHAIPTIHAHTYNAYKAGIKLACGGDIGPVAHGQNVRELELMVTAGIPLVDVLTAATLHGWEACGGDRCGRRFGWLEAGCAADLIGIRSDPREDLSALRKVDFVMKDAKAYVREGKMVDWSS